MRTQSAAYVAAHAQSRSDTELFGNEAEDRHRYCTQAQCSGLRVVDSTAHVMPHCPAHNVPRRVMAAAVGAALSAPTTNAHIISLDAAGTDTRRVLLLLGSPPPLTIGASNTHYTAVL
jgi:hypothetical protein